jgi:hypothetical protein
VNEQELELAEIKDQAETIGFLTPIEFAKLMGIAPQLVYYHIRNKNIEVERCRCGRRVVSVPHAQEALQKAARKQRGALDTRHDADRQEGQGPALS